MFEYVANSDMDYNTKLSLFYSNSGSIFNTTTNLSTHQIPNIDFPNIATTSTFPNKSLNNIYNENDNESVSPFETWSTSELVEMAYQILLFTVGAPLNIYALLKFSRLLKKFFFKHFCIIFIYTLNFFNIPSKRTSIRFYLLLKNFFLVFIKYINYCDSSTK